MVYTSTHRKKNILSVGRIREQMMIKKPIIRLVNLEKTFRGKSTTVYALRDINLEINPGDIFGIIGMSGAGKSTLIRCINFLEKPTGGKVYINDRDLSVLTHRELRELRQDVSMIFQHFNLLQQRTVRGNIAFSMEIAGKKPKEINDTIHELLEIVGLSDKANAYPSQLSGGQKQRVAIARALATNPKIILCDEATSALDPNTTQAILKLLKEINKKMGITIVMITHEMSVVESICSHVAILDQGSLVEQGTVEKVFTQPSSAAGKRLMYHPGNDAALMGKRCIRVVFDGNSSFEPIISNLIMECKVPVNIMFADTKDIDGKAFGQMILQLPQDPLQGDKVIYYLKDKKLKVEELKDYVGL